MPDGSWVDLYTNEAVQTDGMWRSGQPNGEDLEECLSYDAYTGEFVDRACSNEEVLCFTCVWTKEPMYSLRGLCSNANVDTNFNLVPHLTYDKNIFFLGFVRSSILFSNEMKSWLIVEDKQKELFLSNATKPTNIIGVYTPDRSGNQLPIGMHSWNITGCQDQLMLKLTPVSSKHIQQKTSSFSTRVGWKAGGIEIKIISSSFHQSKNNTAIEVER